MARAGRPKSTLPRATATITRRVRTLVDTAHGGNLGEAARASGLPYPTLRELYVGRTANPAIRTIETLAAPYGLPLEWFTAAGAGDALPRVGATGLLPPHPATPMQRHGLRRVPIPFAAWPMYDVYRRVREWLERIEPSSGRPIVHEATGESLTFRLTTFLLQPLLAAEKLGEPDVIPFGVGDEEPAVPAGEVGAHWVFQLTSLGRMWQAVLEDVLDSAGTVN